MTTTASLDGSRFTTSSTAAETLIATERRLYDAETALHAAHQTHVDTWIAAAYDRLHEAVVAYTQAALSASVT
ncbi:MAG TPA: hypothetical protein VHS54_09835 [Jatrophihabitans sp.]|jgi:hypothetical protein|nr:hypothetical protein [Jatrophihabitans sp.]